MKNKLVKFTLFNELADYLGHKEWNLNVKSVNEGLQALNTLTNGKFNQFFVEKNKLRTKYRILLNGNDFICEGSNGEINESNAFLVKNSEIYLKNNALETVDIVPFIENADIKGMGFIQLILGVVLIGVGLATTLPFLAMAGFGLAMSGTSALLARAPDFKLDAQPAGGNKSYAFSGPTNIIGEGGPIPVGYGRAIIGSQVINAPLNVGNSVVRQVWNGSLLWSVPSS